MNRIDIIERELASNPEVAMRRAMNVLEDADKTTSGKDLSDLYLHVGCALLRSRINNEGIMCLQIARKISEGIESSYSKSLSIMHVAAATMVYMNEQEAREIFNVVINSIKEEPEINKKRALVLRLLIYLRKYRGVEDLVNQANATLNN